VPIYADRGPSGGFQLLDGYRTRLTGLSPAEAETLSLAGLPGPAAQLGLADVLTAAQLKLSAALPERARANAGRIAARFHLDPVGWFRNADEAKLLPTIANAVWSEKCLDVHYRRAEGAVERRLQPLGLVLKAGVWYLVAQVGDQPRTYRVSNIIDLAVTEESFERRKDFDLARFWVTSSRAFETSVYHSSATLRVTARGLAKLDVLGSLVAQAAAETATPADADGWISVTIPIESVERAASGLIALGADAEVVEPRGIARAARRDGAGPRPPLRARAADGTPPTTAQAALKATLGARGIKAPRRSNGGQLLPRYHFWSRVVSF
jgi:predicted DNA-binding transcriptional regulator YafY